MPRKYKMLVEGKDDEHVLYSLLEHHRVPEQFKIKNKEGLEKLLNQLDVEHDESDLERLGIIVDADFDLAARWQSIKTNLLNIGYNLPDVPNSEGTIIAREDGRIMGVWLMPDNKLMGMLEDFVSFLGATGDPLWSIAGNCLNEISEEHQKFIPNHRIKAHIHTWLAWQEDPGTPLGLAITKRYLNADALHAQQLMGWIRRLFDLSDQ